MFSKIKRTSKTISSSLHIITHIPSLANSNKVQISQQTDNTEREAVFVCLFVCVKTFKRQFECLDTKATETETLANYRVKNLIDKVLYFELCYVNKGN